MWYWLILAVAVLVEIILSYRDAADQVRRAEEDEEKPP